MVPNPMLFGMQEMNRTLCDMGHGGGAGSGHTQVCT